MESGYAQPWFYGMSQAFSISRNHPYTRIIDLLCQMILKRSKQQPVIIVVEDLHWIDQSSEDFFMTLVESLASSAILLLATYRPGYQPPWIGQSYVTQIALSRLTPADSLTVVHSIGQQDALPQSVARAILEKADGNPLFLEELTRVIVTQGGIRPDSHGTGYAAGRPHGAHRPPA